MDLDRENSVEDLSELTNSEMSRDNSSSSKTKLSTQTSSNTKLSTPDNPNSSKTKLPISDHPNSSKTKLSTSSSHSHRQLVLVRHGESEWNRLSIFTGWYDTVLTPLGKRQAIAAGRAIREAGIDLPFTFCSRLSRATVTMDLVLEHAQLSQTRVAKLWQLNEKHYGELQGLMHQDMIKKHGQEQVTKWRRGFDCPPPLAGKDSPNNPANDPKYKDVPREDLPRGESFKLLSERVSSAFQTHIKPRLQHGNVLIVAHTHTIRVLIGLLTRSPLQSLPLDIPNANPLVYTLAKDGSPVSGRYLLPHDGLLPPLCLVK